MDLGQTVFYRLDEKQSEKFLADCKAENIVLPYATILIFPATVVTCYSAGTIGHNSFGEKVEQDSYKIFSGVADLNVHLPGKILYVHNAKEDVSPTVLPEGLYGHGVTPIPRYGMYTQASPAPLLS